MSLLFIILSGHLYSAGAQNLSSVDSLKAALKTQHGIERYDILEKLFKAYNMTDYNISLSYAYEAYDLALSVGDSVKVVEAGRMVAFSLLDLGRNEDAIDILNKILKTANRNAGNHPDLKPKIKFILNNAGIAYTYLGLYDSALSYHYKSLLVREEEGDKKSIGTALNNIGLVYYKLKNYEQGINFYQRALDLKTELNDKQDVDKIYINIGLCYNGLMNSKKALEAFDLALKTCGTNCFDEQTKEASFGIGLAFLNLNKFDSAEVNLNKSLSISLSMNDKRYIIDNLIHLIVTTTSEKDYSKAMSYLKMAKEYENETQFPESLINLYKVISDVYSAQNDFKNASLYQAKYIQLKDSIYSGQLLENLTKVQNAHAQRENIKIISEQDRILSLQKELIKRQRVQYGFILIIAILFVTLAAVLIRSNRKQNIQNNQIRLAKEHIDFQNEQLKKANQDLDQQVFDKTSELLKVNDVLRKVNGELDNFIYRTSHDIRGPLVTLKGICNVAMMDVSDPLAKDYFQKFNYTVDKLNEILTRLLLVNRIAHWQLAPLELDLKHLAETIIDNEKAKGLPKGMTIEIVDERNDRIITDGFLLGLIIENLISNAIKFYNNSGKIIPSVWVKIGNENTNQVGIIVKDNGVGIMIENKEQIFQLFNRASERSETGGIGLYISRLAANRIGGEVKLLSTSQEGSEFKVILPNDISPIVAARKAQEELLNAERAKRL